MKNKLFPNYVFYFPFHSVGGVSILFLRIAEYLSSNYQTPCYIIDYKDGYMAKNRKSPLIKLIEFSENNSIQIPSDSILILQSDLPWGIPQNFIASQSTTVFFWNCYPFNLIPVFPSPIKELMSRNLKVTKFILNTILLPSKIKTKNLLVKLLSHHAITFMDNPNLTATEYCLGLNIEKPQFLPISIQKSNLKKQFIEINPKKSLNLCWVGRIADFKIHILNRTIEDCYNYSTKNNFKITFIIIGSGDQESNILNKFQQTFFEIKSIPYLNENELSEYLISNVDCVFAMGTSALEAAKLGIPSILLDFSYSYVKPGYRYNFLFNTKKYSMGDLITDKNYSDGYSIDEIIDHLINNMSVISSKSLDYFLKNHSLEANITLFLEQSQNSTLEYNNLIQTTNLDKPLLYKIWALIKKVKSFF